MKKQIIQFLSVASVAVVAVAQTPVSTPASVPYMPSWQARHALQLLADHAQLPLTLTHWPLPAAAVQEALSRLPATLPASEVDLEAARSTVQRELQSRSFVRVQVRPRAEGLTGFDENYTPGSSTQLQLAEQRLDAGAVSVAGRLGLKLEETSYALAQASNTSMGTEGSAQLRLDGSAAVLGWQGWNVQAFSQRYSWGPGWQSSLVNGSNAPAWNGVGVQRGSAQASDSRWLGWMGPWNLDVFVAQAQDPVVVADQPVGYLFSGMRLTMKPLDWLEVGFSRGFQAGGQGRPGGVKNFIKSFFGQEVNHNPGDAPDTSSQIAGYDVRVRCPQAWGHCAAYTQWMGEDAAGKLPLPYKFMNLWGLEQTLGDGRHRVFIEYTNTNAYSLPWDTKPQFPGYGNGQYGQGYTNGGRWIGSAQGGGSQVTTLGWMDAQSQRMVKLHVGKVLWSVGSGYPGVAAPHGDLRGISASQTWQWMNMQWTPELSWLHLSEGQDVGASRRNNVRAGITLQIPL